MNPILAVLLVIAGLATAFAAYIALLEYLSRRRARKLEPLLGVVSPPKDKK